MRKFSIDVTLSLVLAFGLALQASALGISYTGGCDYSFTLAPDQDNFFHKDCNITSSIQTTTIRLESHEDFAAIDVSPGSIFFFYNDVKLDEVTIRNNFEKAFLEIFDNIGHSTTFFTYDSARYIENDQALNLTFTLDPSGFTWKVPCSGNTTTDEAIIDTNPGTSWSDQVFNGDLSVPTIIALLEIPKIDQKDLKQLEIELGF